MRFAVCTLKNFSACLVVILLTALSGRPVLAEAWHIATFQTSLEEPLNCPQCKENWLDVLQAHIKAPENGKIIRGHFVEINLADPKLNVMVTRRHTDGPCANHVGPISYTKPLVEGPLPVLLRTVPQWVEESQATLAMSGANFHFDNNLGVRAKLPCGEVIGVNLHDGHLDWPPQNQPELLRELIDANPLWPADTLLLHSDRRAYVVRIQDYNQLEPAAFGIAGSALYSESIGENQQTGTKPQDRIARLVIGVMPERQRLLVLMVEGDSNTKSHYERGIHLRKMRAIMKDLGAVDAINMDGSGSAQIVGPNGFATRPSDTQGARPIANHIGFRMSEEPVNWTPYGARH